MKFPFAKAVKKQPFGIEIIEHCISNNPFPIDCAIAYFRDKEYPCKINHGFHEMFFIIEGECFVEFEDEIVFLTKGDVNIIEPERKHITRAKYANILVSCTPPFDIKNVEFCSMYS
jgi:hypothetical protein